jgi:hypothetical protein
MQVVAFNSRVVLRPTVRTKIKRRIKEAVRLIVTRGAAVEESRGSKPRVVFRPEDVGAEKWIVPGTPLLHLLGEATLSYQQTGHTSPFLQLKCFAFLSRSSLA